MVDASLGNADSESRETCNALRSEISQLQQDEVLVDEYINRIQLLLRD